MQSIQNLKRRLKGVQNISQITKAMELVAAAKMRRSQETAIASRPYAFTTLEFLANISRLQDIKIPPLLEKRPIEKTCFVLVTSDKGLAGAFNSAVIREFERSYKSGKRPAFAKASADAKALADRSAGKQATSDKDTFIAIGQKAANYFQKKSLPIVQKFVRVGDFTTVEEVKPIADFLISGYLQKEWDRVMVFSTHFRSALKQEPLIRQILPVEFENLRQTVREIIPETGRFAELIKEKRIEFFADESKIADYLIEPSPEIILQELVPHLVLMQIYHLVLEANASEHAARRLAMKNASDNAEELSADLTLEYNKSRQASITREIIEVTSGAESLK